MNQTHRRPPSPLLPPSAAAAPPDAPFEARPPPLRRAITPTTSLAEPSEVAAWLTAAKCDDVASLDVGTACPFAASMVFATARSTRHAVMAAEAVAHKLKERAVAAGADAPPPVEGDAGSDWLLVDAGAVLAHVFVGEARERIGLERLWSGQEEEEEGGGGVV